MKKNQKLLIAAAVLVVVMAAMAALYAFTRPAATEGAKTITVDGEDAVYEEDGAYWALYEGEEYAQQGVDATPATDGGRYGLVYTVG